MKLYQHYGDGIIFLERNALNVQRETRSYVIFPSKLKLCFFKPLEVLDSFITKPIQDKHTYSALSMST